MKIRNSIGILALFGIVGSMLAQQPGPGAKPPPPGPDQKLGKQQPGGGAGLKAGGAGNGAFLLLMPTVQNELKLTDDQKAALKNAMPDFGGERTKGDKTANAAAKPSGEAIQKFMDAVKATLTQQQADRLQQLVLQREGPTAIMNPQVADKLGMTKEQRVQSQEVLKSVLIELKGQNLEPNERREKMQAARAEAGSKILALLTEQQRATWNSMLGVPFSFAKR